MEESCLYGFVKHGIKSHLMTVSRHYYIKIEWLTEDEQPMWSKVIDGAPLLIDDNGLCYSGWIGQGECKRVFLDEDDVINTLTKKHPDWSPAKIARAARSSYSARTSKKDLDWRGWAPNKTEYMNKMHCFLKSFVVTGPITMALMGRPHESGTLRNTEHWRISDVTSKRLLEFPIQTAVRIV